MSTRVDYQSPTKECDVVMKGGVTSGIVYPDAILELAGEYRFRSIGGASAGAIAAALTAAAEYGRHVIDAHGRGGFERLRLVADELSQEGRLRDLFQPSPLTAPLHRALLAVLPAVTKSADEARSDPARAKRGPLAGFATFWKWNWVALRVALVATPGTSAVSGVLAFALVGLVAWLVARGAGRASDTEVGTVAWIVIVVLALVAAGSAAIVASGVRLSKTLLNVVPRNLFGVCSGHTDEERPPSDAPLTDWLHLRLQEVAGRTTADPPLTLGDLRTPPGDRPAESAIELQMITTCLTQARPYVVPFERSDFLFRISDMKRLFPAPVVGALVRHARQSERIPIAPSGDLRLLPEPEHLPVLFSARISMSFPMLISAIPLYTVSTAGLRRVEEARKRGETATSIVDSELLQQWFSDGGITSNFPIHLFDGWVPSRPTFGINLTSLPDGHFEPSPVRAARDSAREPTQKYVREEMESSRADVEAQDTSADDLLDDLSETGAETAVFLGTPNRPARIPALKVRSVPGFLGAIWETAQNYRDNAQAALPGHRERIVEVRFATSEGGLNLAMDTDTIRGIRDKGARAGQLLRDEFDFEHHRWVRVLVLMAELEHEIIRLRRVSPDREALRKALSTWGGEGFPYARDEAWRGRAQERIDLLATLVEGWSLTHDGWVLGDERRKKSSFFRVKQPRPAPALRLVPRH